jgi:hypothetical protein
MRTSVYTNSELKCVCARVCVFVCVCMHVYVRMYVRALVGVCMCAGKENGRRRIQWKGP